MQNLKVLEVLMTPLVTWLVIVLHAFRLFMSLQFPWAVLSSELTMLLYRFTDCTINNGTRSMRFLQ